MVMTGLNSKGKEEEKMKAFYAKLKEAEKSGDARIAKLAEVCKADLKKVQKKQTFSDWSWWTE